MAAMGVGRIRTVVRVPGDHSGESVTFAGRKMVRPVGRRLFMQASGLVAVSALGACGDSSGSGSSGEEDYSYVLEALVVAAADIAGVYLIGVPVGTMLKGAVEVVNAADGGDPKPPSVDVAYKSPSAQGTGTVKEYDFSGMPRSSEKKGKASMDTQGDGWVQLQNTTDDNIEYVKLVRDSGDEVLPTNQGMSGFLDSTWRSGDDLYLTGVPTPGSNQYTRLFFQTTNGKQGYINLT